MVLTKVKWNPMYIPNTIIVFELVFKPSICSVNRMQLFYSQAGFIRVLF